MINGDQNNNNPAAPDANIEIPGYAILRKINSGGMASVFLATQLSLNRTVALKIMKPELDYDPEFHERFQREAEIVGQLSHPNIIPIYDIGRYQAMNYISMEYLPAGSLEQKIAEGITASDVINIVIAIASALEHAHSKGYVHRDIKPENILFRDDNSPVLTDFGIARTIKSDSKVTQVGIVIGTPYYMSPEQAKGLHTDGRADLYSLGILFYEMLTGERPFQSHDALTLALQHISDKVPNLPAAFFQYQPIIDLLLAKTPEQRFQHAQELIQALEAAKNSANPMLTQINSKAHRLQLFKAVGYTVVHDGKLAAEFLHKQSIKLFNKIRGIERDETILLATIVTSEIQNAKTGLYQAAATDSLETKPKYSVYKKTVVYGALGILLTITIGTLIIGSKQQNQREQIKDLFSKNEAQSITDLFPLTIIATPETATIRILNIVEKYSPGMTLPAGEYHIEIKSPGYQTKNEWIKLPQDNQSFNFPLAKAVNTTETGNHIIPPMVAITVASHSTTDSTSATDSSQKNKPLNNFYISKYEINFNEYDDFAIATNRSLPDDNGWGRGERPVINVSWDDAQAYVNWLSKTTGDYYRLPTNAEWEFSARGNTTSLYWWGNNENDASGRANCRFDCKSIWSSLFENKTAIIGSFPPNDFGIHDSAGNVSEWIEDCHSTAENSPCEQRIIRGGSFRDSAKNITAISANYLSASSYNNYTGFRVVKEINETKKPDKEFTKPPAGNAFQRFINKFRR